MYRYDAFDQQFVDERVAQFRDQTRRYLDGSLSHGEFLHLRLRNGLYIQRLAPMLRVAVPYGTLSSKQLRMLAHIARTMTGYGHRAPVRTCSSIGPIGRSTISSLILQRCRCTNTNERELHPQCHDDQFGGVAGRINRSTTIAELIRQWSTPSRNLTGCKFKVQSMVR
jgi:sulfite reductase (NADPH) hemoprotein beta-component